MKQGWKKYLLYSCAVLVLGGFVLFFIRLGYSYSWTGFGEYTPTNTDTVRNKTLWDWMDLLIIPTVLALGAIALNRSEKKLERESIEARAKLEREIADERQQDAVLQTYFDRMSELLLKDKLRTTKKAEVRDIARTRTLFIMRVLDTRRNNLVIQFLREAKLVTDKNSILIKANMGRMILQQLNLQDVDLRDANLQGANLHNANLQGANLQGANLQDAKLQDANLQGANLQDAKLWWAVLDGAGLSGANLSSADFSDADLSGATLSGATLKGAYLGNTNLQGAFLKGANLYHANLRGTSLQGANLQNAKLQGANLLHAVLVEADFGGASLNGVDLSGADLLGVKLRYANLQGANLRDTKNITQEQLANVKTLKGAIMPDGTKHK